jgi:hypothetical protein
LIVSENIKGSGLSVKITATQNKKYEVIDVILYYIKATYHFAK